MSDKYAGAARTARPPAEPLPPMSCDCHLHVFGDPAKYRDSNPNPIHKTREANWNDALRMHNIVGFDRGVLVQPANYRTDHTYLVEALSRLPRKAYRGIGIMDHNMDDSELLRLQDAGVCGMRFNFVRRFRLAPTPESFRRSIDSIRDYGWYLKIFIGPEELPDHIETLRRVTSVPVVIDHMACLKPTDGPDHPTHTMVIDLLKRDNYWVMLSNGVRMSAQASDWDDVVPIGRRLYEAAPTRSLFGTDWPHAHSHNEGGGPEEARLIALLDRYLPDQAARQAVLVDNPARLHGFG
jgi:2-pyrone-4,6-dicarboxylate lactonase